MKTDSFPRIRVNPWFRSFGVGSGGLMRPWLRIRASHAASRVISVHQRFAPRVQSRKFWKLKAAAKSLVRTAVMTACNSSLLLPVTRISSP